MTNSNPLIGKTTIAPDVLITIAKLTALSVPGVARLAPVPGGVNRFFQKGAYEGVQISVEDNTVDADIYVILKKETTVREVCRDIQAHIARAISEMVGMDIGKVNIHVEDIEYNDLESSS
jgi:uncharacterized alkaline shock family protein YloU